MKANERATTARANATKQKVDEISWMKIECYRQPVGRQLSAVFPFVFFFNFVFCLIAFEMTRGHDKWKEQKKRKLMNARQTHNEQAKTEATTNNFIQHNRQNSHNDHDEKKINKTTTFRCVTSWNCYASLHSLCTCEIFRQFPFRGISCAAHFFSQTKQIRFQTGGSLWIWNMNLNLILSRRKLLCEYTTQMRCHNHKQPTKTYGEK